MEGNSVHLPFFCIVGRARSGTTLLRMLLDGHPEVIIPPECAFVQHMHSKFAAVKVWNEATIKEFIQCLHKEPAYELLHVNEEKLKSDILKSGDNSTYGDVCKLVYANSRSVFAKSELRIVGDKNPAYSLYLEGLSSIFPEIKFIHITRDYRDNIRSMKQVDFESGITASLAYRWKYYNNTINSYKKKHPEKFMTVRYEDLVSDTEGNLKRICEFLEISFMPEMLDFTDKKDSYYELYPQEALNKYHGNLFKPVSGVPVNRWKEQMSTFEIKVADAVAGSSAEANGYKRMYQKFNPVIWLYALPGVIYGRLYFTWGRLINILPWSIKMRLIHGMAAVFNPYWKRYTVKINQGNR
jgi:hypothetical protein